MVTAGNYTLAKIGNILRLSGVGGIRLRGKARFSGTPKTCEIIRKRANSIYK
jgi:hypothetical protein